MINFCQNVEIKTDKSRWNISDMKKEEKSKVTNCFTNTLGDVSNVNNNNNNTALGRSALWLAEGISSMDTWPAPPAAGGNQTDSKPPGSDRTCAAHRSCRTASCDTWCRCGGRSLTTRKWAGLRLTYFAQNVHSISKEFPPWLHFCGGIHC